MKLLLTVFSVLLLSTGFGQRKEDLTKNNASPERKAILNALKEALHPDLNLTPKLVVKKLVTKGGFAYFIGRVKNEKGGDIDFRKTAYKEAVKERVFDGDGTNALLRKTGNKWKVLTFVIGPTDVPWGCWWKEFKAPKDIFDYTEKNCDYAERNK
ncbi:hypothetical protein [Flavisolibacter ginsenosidimutans]|uniref:Uncharacterized protein n=1 Tax=Flavisolibacter ginsenosidimutans TaxID=661481 RepID=A0A5B8UFY0_9BACT|nr:hypothetical protein [Flavisolibacter ginsenosidimutans]QEC55398.1 hypothetical protein FSB75_05585 [Flavisolibacter ginsenosidimutans]